MDSHINIAAIIHLIFGGLGMLTGAAVLAWFLLFGGIGGAAALTEGAAEGLAAFGGMTALGVFFGGCIGLLSLPETLAGYGLLKRRPWAPMVALIVSFLQLFNFPFGTALAAYTGWVLLSEEGQRTYKLGGRSYGRLP